MSEQKNTAELLVIGTGVIAMSVAYHCAEAGVDVVVLGRDQPGATATQTAGAFRTYFPGRVYDSELVARSLADFRSFGATTGAELEVTQTGMLVVAASADEADELLAEVPAQRDAGVQLELLTAAQAVERNPWLDPAGVEAALWCPQMIRLRADEVLRGYTEGAQKHGARLVTGATVTGLDASGGRVATTAGDFTAEAIVLADESGSGDIAALAGFELPVWGQFAELFHTDPIGDGDVASPFTFHPAAGLKTMGMGPSFLVGLERFSRKPGMRDIWHEAAMDEVAQRYPRLRDVTLHSAWTGTLDVTPSRSALIGRAGGPHERILFATGFTGHELGQAPATGKIIRDLHLGRHPGVDITPFSLARNGA
ncbi:FAD-binding oxidoreductase [Streptomyces sp. A1547]|uniref:NAD(P)/FAD-dependent oxidoreductase n=1 Tax=Streptomyces sp. A1547 TaxID=2563105 RepID=UPI00109E5BF2|nr:FAD-binding oxidoreductase [Streptomyces sp. A1547]THA34650.1 FAD-binding oxidoreductase [Streptomyces sp. A1547]